MLATEMQRYRAGQQMAKFDSERYNMKEPPQSKKNDIATWQNCIQNAHSQLEHQLNRLAILTCMVGMPAILPGDGQAWGPPEVDI